MVCARNRKGIMVIITLHTKWKGWLVAFARNIDLVLVRTIAVKDIDLVLVKPVAIKDIEAGASQDESSDICFSEEGAYINKLLAWEKDLMSTPAPHHEQKTFGRFSQHKR
jgi:hypothetical protein